MKRILVMIILSIFALGISGGGAWFMIKARLEPAVRPPEVLAPLVRVLQASVQNMFQHSIS